MSNKPLSKYSNEFLLDALVETANLVDVPSESNFLSDVRAELLKRLTQRAVDGICACIRLAHWRDDENFCSLCGGRNPSRR